MDKLGSPNNLYPVLITTYAILSMEEIKVLTSYYRLIIMKAKIYQDQYKERKQNIEFGFDGILNLNVFCKKDPKGYVFWSSNRMASKFAMYTYDDKKSENIKQQPRNKSKRSEVLKGLGMNVNEDIKSSGLVIVRTCNGWKFEINYNITDELLKLKLKSFDGELLTKDTIKGTRFRYMASRTIDDFKVLYFAGTRKWTKNKKPKKPKDILQTANKSTIEELYCGIDNLVGSNIPYMRIIFPLESLIAMRVINKMCSLGLKIQNVYDCFYYDSNEINMSDFQQLLSDIIQNTCEEYGFLNELNGNQDSFKTESKIYCCNPNETIMLSAESLYELDSSN